MKLGTAYWGAQLLAETEDDEKILRALVESVTDDTGGMIIIKDISEYKHHPNDPLPEADVRSARLVVEIIRP